MPRDPRYDILFEPVDIGPVSAVVLVTSRIPKDDLYNSLRDEVDIERIGDCLAPGTIATAVYSGHRYAREMDEVVPVGVPFLRER